MLEPGRKFAQGNSKYRYGFNGKELDKETSSTTTYDYGFRIYNPALGRFLSVDPLTKDYPWNSTYAFAENDVIRSIDLDGLEKLIVTEYYRGNRLHHTVFSGMRASDTKNAVNMNMKSALNIKLTAQDVYLIKRDMKGNVISEAPAGKLDKYYQGIVSKAKTVQGEDVDNLPENTMQQTETSGRGRFIKSALIDNTKNEFFELTVLKPQPLPASISAQFNITSLNQEKVTNENEISDGLDDIVDFLNANPKSKITLTAYIMGYDNMPPLKASDVAKILNKATAVKKLLVSRGAKSSQIKTASGGAVIDFDKADKVEVKPN
jgi:RHS repeat-associated protein